MTNLSTDAIVQETRKRVHREKNVCLIKICYSLTYILLRRLPLILKI